MLRVAASLQVLFSLQVDREQQPSRAEIIHISEDAIKASINFVELCCQQTAFIAGRNEITRELDVYKTGILS